MPERIEIDPERIEPRKIARAVAVLHDGGVAAYPTDTVYALGCAIEARKAVEAIYRAKQMANKQRLAIICPDVSTAAQYGQLGDEAFRIARRIFPGPYTLVVRATRSMPRTLMDKKRRQVGIRIPDHPVTLAIVRELGRPLLTTSAMADLDDTLDAYGHVVDVAVDSGPTAGDVSTVFSVDDGGVEILREGVGPVDRITG